jgi:hypothetical protein
VPVIEGLKKAVSGWAQILEDVSIIATPNIPISEYGRFMKVIFIFFML